MRLAWQFVVFLMIAIRPGISTAAFEGHEGGNGGDEIGLQFQDTAAALVEEIKTLNEMNLLTCLDPTQIASATENTKVMVTENALLVEEFGVAQESAAENFQNPNLILVNRDRWNGIVSQEVKQALVLHEILGVMGKEGTGNYALTFAFLRAEGISCPDGNCFKAPTAAALDPAVIAHPNAADVDGVTPLMKSAASDGPTNIETLLKAGAKVSARDKNGLTALFYAAKSNHNSDSLLALLQAGAKLDDHATNGRTPLAYAASGNIPQIAAFLVHQGANVNEAFTAQETAHTGALVTNPGMTALMYAAGLNQMPEMITTLVQLGAKLEMAESRSKTTPLFFAAAQNSNADVTAALLAVGANVRARNKEGEDPLFYAIWNSNPAVIELLAKKGDDVNEQLDVGTPLILAAAAGSDAIVKALVSLGADIRLKGQTGEGRYATPFQVACTYHRDQTVLQLFGGGTCN